MALADNEKNSGFNTPAVVLVGLAVIIFVFGFTLFLQGGFLKVQDLEKQTKVMTPENLVVKNALAAQEALLQEGVRWIDQEKGTVGMPLEDAKALLVKQEARKESEF